MARSLIGTIGILGAALLITAGCNSSSPTTPAPKPIVVTSPTKNQVYHIGDTLHITWQENSSSLTGIVVFLSTNNNISYENAGNSLTGSHDLQIGVKKLDYVLTSSIFQAGDIPSTECVIAVANYEPYQDPIALSDTFTIQP